MDLKGRQAPSLSISTNSKKGPTKNLKDVLGEDSEGFEDFERDNSQSLMGSVVNPQLGRNEAKPQPPRHQFASLDQRKTMKQDSFSSMGSDGSYKGGNQRDSQFMKDPKDYNKKTRDMMRDKGMAADVDSDDEFERAKRKRIAAMNAASRELADSDDERGKKTDKYYQKDRDRSRSRSPSDSPRQSRKRARDDSEDYEDDANPMDYYEENMKKIVKYVDKRDIDVGKLFKVQSRNGTLVCTEKEFISYFSDFDRQKIPRDQVAVIARKFRYHGPRSRRASITKMGNLNGQENVVDLNKLQDEIFIRIQNSSQDGILSLSKKQSQKNYSDRREAHVTLEEIYEKVEDFVLTSGGSVFDCFKFMDEDDSSFIDSKEFKNALVRLGLESITTKQVKQVFEVFDINGDGKLSYDEFQEIVSNVAGDRRITNPNHWAFHIVEQFRRDQKRNRRSIVEIFNGQYDQATQRYFAEWDPFIQQLQRYTPITKHHQKRIKTLLDVVNKGGRVDLKVFQTIVGVEEEKGIAAFSGRKQNSDSEFWKVDREATRELMFQIATCQINVSNLKGWFIQASQGQSNIDRQVFEEYLMDEVQVQNLSESKLAKITSKIGNIFKVRGKGDRVDYDEFLFVYEYYESFFKLISHVFGCCVNSMRKNRFEDFSDIIDEFGPKTSKSSSKLTKTDAQQFFTNLLIRLQPQEIEIIIDEFDPQGIGKQMDLTLLESFFNYWWQNQASFEEAVEDQQQQELFSDDSEEVDALSIHRQRLLDVILTRISRYFDENNVKLSEVFKKVKKLTEKTFILAICSAAYNGRDGEFDLTEGEQRTILARYSRGKKIDTERFLDEIKKRRKVLEELNKLSLQIGKSFNDSQIYLLDKLKQWMDATKCGVQLVIEFKRRDEENTGYINEIQIQDVFQVLSMQVTNEETTTLTQMIKIKDKRYCYQDIIEMLLGQDIGQRIVKFSINALQRGDFKEIQTFKKKPFYHPLKLENPATQKLGLIGKLLINQKQNYEAAIIKVIGKEQDKSLKPMITQDQINEAFQSIKIILTKELNSELDDYCKKMSAGSSAKKQLKLLNFLEDIGLPAQTIGALNKNMSQASILLSEKELKNCQMLLIELKYDIKSKEDEMQYSKLTDLWLGNKRHETDEGMDFQTFVRQIEQSLESKELAKKFKFAEDHITAYLAEKEKNKISYEKLAQALKQSEGDTPLNQGGVQEKLEYKSKITKKLSMVDEKAEQERRQNIVKTFLEFCVKRDITIKELLGQNFVSIEEIPYEQFQQRLKDIEFVSDQSNELIRKLDSKNTGRSVNYKNLRKLMTDAFKNKKMSAQTAQNRTARFGPKIQKLIQKIQKQLESMKITTEKLVELLDENKDGFVDKRELVDKLSGAIKLKDINQQEIGDLFDKLDVNDSGKLTPNEIGLYIDGAQLQKKERIKNIDPTTVQQLKKEIKELFQYFDQNNDGIVSPKELMASLKALGVVKELTECQKMIDTAVGKQNAEGLSVDQFNKLMLPVMEEALLAQEDNIQDLRKKFLEADTDYSGYLSVDELYMALKKGGADVTHDDIIMLMNEIDIDRNGEIDIDEFITLMTMGDQIIQDRGAKNTYSRIQKSRMPNALRILDCFNSMPVNFVKSYTDQIWREENKNTPSSVFKAQVDPKTMLWKDCREPLTNFKHQNSKQYEPKFDPKLYPQESKLQSQITIIEAQGVPGPEILKNQAQKTEIVKRCVRVYVDTPRGNARNIEVRYEIIGNIIQIPVDYNPGNQDIWSFDTTKATKLLRDVLFRSTVIHDDLNEEKSRMVFELVVYIKTGTNQFQISEMCCGWCSMSLSEIKKNQPAKLLTIQGGSPADTLIIESEDIRNKRQGFKAVEQVFKGNVGSVLKIEIKTSEKLDKLAYTHLQVMPSTCLVQQPLLLFASGFMNYKADKLLKELTSGKFTKPSGDVVMSSFSKVYDNPDIIEELVLAWDEIALQEKIKRNKMEYNSQFIMDQTTDFVKRLYPVVFTKEFMEQWVSGTTRSAAGQPNDLESKRKTLVRKALRYDRETKKKEENPFDEETNFKPFSIRELEYDIWDNYTMDSNKSESVINRLNNQMSGDPRHDMSFLNENQNPNKTTKSVSFN